ncbi:MULTISPECIES: APC family permease [unclassified Nesterenkonia]|uniref:APC family permease n=1 Tax=unclassified Nesterenkonia TaxID=2629769 RepID=UPI001F4C87F1|nr:MULTISPECIES: APC family permease [unclassified Nesterenkonia]MCH8559139.1 APC family permease [Nesterenkonia sp. DZ6]MCH8563053.1 APC family permease [Nesterenkonia sp. YGD6]
MTEHTAPTRPTAVEDTTLARRTLGVPALVFLIIAASAPLTVLAGGATASFAVTAEIGVPVGYLLLGVILVFFALGYGRMSTYVQNAGAFYAYVTAGLGTRIGIGSSFLALVTYNAMQVGLYGVFGFTASSIVNDLFGLEVAWWICALVGWVIVGALGVNRIDLSAKVLAVIVLLEFLVVIVVSVLSLSTSPEGISAAPLQLENWFNGSLGAILAFGIAAFMGFESGAIYSEEAKNPERSVARATYIAVSIIAVFYAFSAWAFAVGIGPSQIVAQSQEWGPDLLFIFLDGHLPALLVNLAAVLFMTSIIAAMVAFHNAAARYFFSLGRARVLPQILGRTGASNGAPVAGSLTQSVIGVVFILIFAVAGVGSDFGPLFPVMTMFPWLTNAAGFGLVLLLCLTSVAIMRYFNRDPQQHPLFVRTIAPLISAVGLGIIAVLIMFNFDVMIDSDGFSPLVVVLPGVIVGAGILGLIWGEYLRTRRPELYASVSGADIG